MKLPSNLLDHDTSTELARAPKLAVLLDLDGTVIPFAGSPDEALLDRDAIALVESLQRSGVFVVIVTGRPRSSVAALRAHVPSIVWMAEHGTWCCDQTGEWRGPATRVEIEQLSALLSPFRDTTGVRIELKSLSVALHWRLVAAADKDELITRAELVVEEWLESHPEFERLGGSEMLEVRHRSATKATAVAWTRVHAPGTRIIAIGDDDTDEDMFASLAQDDLAIGVGPRHTRARYRLSDPAAVRQFLGWLREARLHGPARPFPPLELQASTAPSRARLLVVSNRTPPTITGRLRPVGGLVSALEPALRAHDGVWLGWNGNATEGERKLTIASDAKPVRASFELHPRWRSHYYDGFCNRALWPLLHGFSARVSYDDADWEAYKEANTEFARHAVALAEPDGVIWVHDYHLLLAARALRTRGFRGRIGLFLHVPFPQHETFDTLPWAADVVDAMLSFDLVAFHTQQWADNFRECARWHARDRPLPDVGVLPIGVDPEAFQLRTAPLDREVSGLRAALGERRLILGVDRLDYAKGIPERLLAFERLLADYPIWRARVSFVQISVPSRAEVPEYAELRDRVENLVGRINGRFGEADWVPVRYLYRSYDQTVLSQLYRLADVALVTPLRDGLNLVAKEFVVAQDPERPGVLVLSRFAGAAAELRDAVLTNPYHPAGVAADIDAALRMGLDERRRRHALLEATVLDNTPARWASAFLERLASVDHLRQRMPRSWTS